MSSVVVQAAVVQPPQADIIGVFRTVTVEDAQAADPIAGGPVEKTDDQLRPGSNQSFFFENFTDAEVLGIKIDFGNRISQGMGSVNLPVITNSVDITTSDVALVELARFKGAQGGRPDFALDAPNSVVLTNRPNGSGGLDQTHFSAVHFDFSATGDSLLPGEQVQLTIGDLDAYIGNAPNGPIYSESPFQFSGEETVRVILDNGTALLGFFHEGQLQSLGSVIFFTEGNIVPLPASLVMLLGGLGGFAFFRRRTGSA